MMCFNFYQKVTYLFDVVSIIVCNNITEIILPVNGLLTTISMVTNYMY